MPLLAIVSPWSALWPKPLVPHLHTLCHPATWIQTSTPWDVDFVFFCSLFPWALGCSDWRPTWLHGIVSLLGMTQPKMLILAPCLIFPGSNLESQAFYSKYNLSLHTPSFLVDICWSPHRKPASTHLAVHHHLLFPWHAWSLYNPPCISTASRF